MTPSSNPPSTSPYKSRLLSQLNRQRLVWRDRLLEMGRKVQNTVEWGGQALLYPLYLLTQLGRGLSVRLAAAVEGSPRFPQQKTLPESDRPIQSTLEQIAQWFSTTPVQTAKRLAIAPALEEIQGIASDRPTHRLVVVSTANQSHDCLSGEQQIQLRHLMVQALIDQSQQQYLFDLKAQQYRVPPQLTHGLDVLQPVRQFWQMMQWLQRSPLAISANVCGEVELDLPLLMPPDAIPHPFPNAALPQNQLLLQVDETIAIFETRQQDWTAQLQQWWQSQAEVPGDPLTKVRRTVQASLGFVLGLDELVPVTPPKPDAATSVWLSWEELTDHSRDQFTASVPQEISLIETEMAIDLTLQETEARSHPSPHPSRLTPNTNQTTANPNPTLTHPTQTTADPDYQPDWIEVESHPSGYETHVVAQILNGFDRVMVAIEDAALLLWRKMKQFLAKI